jgi:putative SOS response-associated peptidase YedK
MCGRYVVAYDPDTLVSGFSLTRVQPFPKRWNVAPQAMVPVVHETREGERVVELMRWGLVPHWAKDETIGNKLGPLGADGAVPPRGSAPAWGGPARALNNARAEGMAEKPSFRQAVRRRRCLLPASGYYEWQPIAQPSGRPVKQPYYISPKSAPFFAMAGLFEAWRAPGSDESSPWLLSCCVITTDARPPVAHIHDRMPVMIAPEHWAAWLSRANQDAASLPQLMAGLPDAAVQAWPVSRAVNRSSNDGETLIEPLPQLS